MSTIRASGDTMLEMQSHSMRYGARYSIACLLGVGMLLGGCYNPGGLEPLIFPNEGRAGIGDALGSTHVMFIDSNYLGLDDTDEWLDISPDRIEVIIRDEEISTPAFEVAADIRAVFDISPDSWSFLGLTQQGLATTVVVFDLPSNLSLGSPTYGHDVSVNIKLDGSFLYIAGLAHGLAERQSSFRLTGADGVPQELMWSNGWAGQESWLQRPSGQALIRLRAKRTAFAPTEGIEIGSVEFDIRYNLTGTDYDDCVSVIQASRTSAEATGLTVLGVASGDEQHVALVSPEGFELTKLTLGYYDSALVGEGPFLDLFVARGPSTDPGCADLSATSDWFEIWDLRVTDIDGTELFTFDDEVPVDTADSTITGAAFRAYLIDAT